MAGSSRLALASILLSAALGLAGVNSVAAGTPAPVAATAPLLWPGGGRMLSSPLVIGGTVLGAGSLEMVGGQITSATANFDQAPPELSLRLFTMVPNTDGGLTAILRFRVPVVLLHSWRGHAVRETMTVVVTPPSGKALAVQLQPDGTVMSGAYGSGHVTAAGAGRAVINGDVAVFGIPASFRTAPTWTVQAMVTVQANEPLHPNRPATGYAAGTSIVPVGLLTGSDPAPPQTGIADATTALTSPAAAPSGVAGLRPAGMRVEGSGTDQLIVVSLDGPPSLVGSIDHPHLDLDVAVPGFATLDHPVRLTWLPNGSDPVTSAQVFVDTTPVGDLPVAVSGNEVRFATGRFVARTPPPSLSTPPLNTMQYRAVVPIGRDEAVNSADGMSDAARSTDTAELVVDGPTVTITPPAPGVPARGAVDAAGRFTAITTNACFTGSVDAVGNVVIYRTALTGAGVPTGHASAPSRRLRAELTDGGDITIADPGPIYPERRDLTIFKADSRFPAPHWKFRTSFRDGSLMEVIPDRSVQMELVFDGLGGAPMQPGGAQGGNPDWPNAPTTGTTTAGTSVAAFAVRASGGTVPAGRPNDAGTPWVLPAIVAATAGSPQPAAGGASPSGGTPGPVVAIVGVIALTAVLTGGVLLRRRSQG